MRFHHTVMHRRAYDPGLPEQAITGASFYSSMPPRVTYSRRSAGLPLRISELYPGHAQNHRVPLTGGALEDQFPAVLLVPLLPDVLETVGANHRQ